MTHPLKFYRADGSHGGDGNRAAFQRLAQESDEKKS
jgi:hypothetical protein